MVRALTAAVVVAAAANLPASATGLHGGHTIPTGPKAVRGARARADAPKHLRADADPGTGIAASTPPTLTPPTLATPAIPLPPLPAGAAGSFDASQSARLQTVLDTWTASAPGVGSMTVAVRMGGRTWVGAARADRNAAPDTSATYRVMSITKTFTAALVLRAVSAGKLTLDGPLPTLEGVPTPIPAGLTVRRLLGHRSGLVDYAEASGYQADQVITPEHAVDLSLRALPVSVPGTTTKYVNSNYLLLGLLLQQVEHRSYPELVADLAGSLGLSHTHVDPPDRPGWAGFSSGGIMSSVGDIALWGDALFTPGRVVSPESLASMATTGDLEGGLGLWGICPCVEGAQGIDRFTAIGHHTVAGGMFHFPQSGMTLVMRAEPDGGDAKGRAVALAQALLRGLAG